MSEPEINLTCDAVTMGNMLLAWIRLREKEYENGGAVENQIARVLEQIRQDLQINIATGSLTIKGAEENVKFEPVPFECFSAGFLVGVYLSKTLNIVMRQDVQSMI